MPRGDGWPGGHTGNTGKQHNPENQHEGQSVCIHSSCPLPNFEATGVAKRDGGVSMVLPGVEGSIPSEYCLMRTRSSLGSSCYPEGQESVEHLNPADQLNLLESIQRSS